MNLKNAFVILTTATLLFASCKSQEEKDAELKARIETAVPGAVVSVNDGVATLNGEYADDAGRASAVAAVKEVTGVKEVVDNASVTPLPPPPPPTPATTIDAATQQKVTDGMKDFQGVNYSFVEDKVIVTGTVTKAERTRIMQLLATAKVKSDTKDLTDK